MVSSIWFNALGILLLLTLGYSSVGLYRLLDRYTDALPRRIETIWKNLESSARAPLLIGLAALSQYPEIARDPAYKRYKWAHILSLAGSGYWLLARLLFGPPLAMFQAGSC